MAKGHNDPGSDNDYIEQLQWRSRHGRRWPIYFEPKWKYKIKYKFFNREVTVAGRILQLITWAGGLYVAYRIISVLLFDPNVELPAKIFALVVVGLTITILFFAARDASRKNIFDDDSKDS